MKVSKLFEAGVGVAYLANESRDRMLELRAKTDELQRKERQLLSGRSYTLDLLGLEVQPEDYDDCTTTDLYMSAVEHMAEMQRFESLSDSAALLFMGALAIENNTMIAK